MGLYKHKITALNGVLNYLENRYPESEAYKGITRNYNRSNRSTTVNYKSVNDLMIEFRITAFPFNLASGNLEKNAEFIQKNFSEFKQFLKNKYEK